MSQFRHNVWKGRVVNTNTANFRQMSKISQQKITQLQCLENCGKKFDHFPAWKGLEKQSFLVC